MNSKLSQIQQHTSVAIAHLIHTLFIEKNPIIHNRVHKIELEKIESRLEDNHPNCGGKNEKDILATVHTNARHNG